MSESVLRVPVRVYEDAPEGAPDDYNPPELTVTDVDLDGDAVWVYVAPRAAAPSPVQPDVQGEAARWHRHPNGGVCVDGECLWGSQVDTVAVCFLTPAELAARLAEAAGAAEAVLIKHEFDLWQPYEARDTGEVFVAEGVRDLIADIRAALAPDLAADEGGK